MVFGKFVVVSGMPVPDEPCSLLNEANDRLTQLSESHPNKYVVELDIPEDSDVKESVLVVLKTPSPTGVENCSENDDNVLAVLERLTRWEELSLKLENIDITLV